MSEPRFDPTGFTVQCNTCLARKMPIEQARRDRLQAEWDAKTPAEKMLEPRPAWPFQVDHDITKAQLQPWASGITFRKDTVMGGFQLVCTEPRCGGIVHRRQSS